jgi:hypothetical protein
MLSDFEVWNKVIQLKGHILYTYVQKRENRIIDVENSNSNNDRVIIVNRKTSPTKKDILTAYKIFMFKKSLERGRDLAHLSTSTKRVSSIIFRIIGEITTGKSKLQIIEKKPPVLILCI